MLLPNADSAVIDPAKLHGYLLSQAHPVGRFKARFFSALGFSAGLWGELDIALRTQHLGQDAVLAESGSHGQSYAIRAISDRTERPIGPGREYLVRAHGRAASSVCDGVPRRSGMNIQPLDVVVLVHDVPTHHLRRGDVGAVVDVYGPDAIAVEFVAASGRTQALVTLKPSDVRASDDRDVLAVRSVASDA